MQVQKQTLINKHLFIGALFTLLAGHISMALFHSEFMRLTIAPLIIIAGFILVVLSLVESKKA